MPHDSNAREIGVGEVALTVKENAENLGIKPVIVVSRVRNMDTVIQVHVPMVRNILGQCWFDEAKCARGISALDGYHSEYDEEKKILGSRPVHDWTSHGADSFRTFAVGYKEKTVQSKSTLPALPRGSGGAFAR
jgi:hypothetical protein